MAAPSTRVAAVAARALAKPAPPTRTSSVPHADPPSVVRQRSAKGAWNHRRTMNVVRQYCGYLEDRLGGRLADVKADAAARAMAECSALQTMGCEVDAKTYNRVLRMAERWGVPLAPLLREHTFEWNAATFGHVLEHHPAVGEFVAVENVLKRVEEVFGMIPAWAWSSVLAGCAHGKHEAEALRYLRRAGDVGARDAPAYAFAMESCRRYAGAKKIHRMMTAAGLRETRQHVLALLNVLGTPGAAAPGATDIVKELEWIADLAKATATRSGGPVYEDELFETQLLRVYRAFGLLRPAQAFVSSLLYPSQEQFEIMLELVAVEGSFVELDRMRQQMHTRNDPPSAGAYRTLLRGCARRIAGVHDRYYGYAVGVGEEARGVIASKAFADVAFGLLECAAVAGDARCALDAYAECPPTLDAVALLRGAYLNAGLQPPEEVEAVVAEPTAEELRQLGGEVAAYA